MQTSVAFLSFVIISGYILDLAFFVLIFSECDGYTELCFIFIRYEMVFSLLLE